MFNEKNEDKACVYKAWVNFTLGDETETDLGFG